MNKYYVILKVFASISIIYCVYVGMNQINSFNGIVFAATTATDPGTSTSVPDINSLLDKLKNGTLTADDQLNLNKLLGDNGNQLDLLNSVTKQPPSTTVATRTAATTQVDPTATKATSSNSAVTMIELIFIIFSVFLLWLNLILLIIYLWQRIKTVDIQKNIQS